MKCHAFSRISRAARTLATQGIHNTQAAWWRTPFTACRYALRTHGNAYMHNSRASCLDGMRQGMQNKVPDNAEYKKIPHDNRAGFNYL